jgi:hypothetical protein
MRVVLAKGRIDVEAEKTFAEAVGKGPPYYSFAAVLNDLEPACRERGWDVHILSVGKPILQRVLRPDVVVNLIAEPLVCKRALDRLEALVRENALPILNKVDAVRRSARAVLPGVIGASNARNIRVPTTTFFSGPPDRLERHIETARHVWPVLLRPAGTHGSGGLRKVESAARMRSLKGLPSRLVVSDFVDFRSGDGLYRKYRMIWVDGTIFRRHLITGLNWNVTGNSRTDMVERPETMAAEKDFLESHDALDDRVAELFRIVGLDFGVIDFAVSDSGAITVFELNGTFQITRSIPSQYLARWGYLEANNGAIVEALVAAIARCAQH